MAFKIGDKVELRSGGAIMTVAEFGYEDEGIRCVWHNPIPKGGFDSKSVIYPEGTLILASEASAERSKVLREAMGNN